MNADIRKRLAEIEAKRAAMPPAERAELERRELEAQRESWVRAMGPCEHGVLDWEECLDCREGETTR
jgi:hypothetical protein